MPLIQDYDYCLPPELVAQYPLPERDTSRLLVVHRAGGEIRHAGFRELAAALDENDVLVVNDTRVFPARLTGRKDSGGKVELLLHHLPEAETQGGVSQGARARATHRGHLRVGQVLNFRGKLTAMVLDLPEPGVAEVRFTAPGDAVAAVLAAGEVPLPPYIQRAAEARDRETYQTVFAAPAGAVACPTAGLHFTGAALKDLEARGVEIVRLTLHVGPGTFMPVRVEDYTRHRMLPEYFELSEAAAAPPQRRQSRRQTPGGGGHHQRPGAGALRLAPGICGATGLVRPLHPSRVPLQGRGPFGHQLSPAPLHPAAPGERLRGAGIDPAGL